MRLNISKVSTGSNRLKIALLMAVTSLCNVPSQAQLTTFNYTGSLQGYTVPAGITSVQIVASGAQGGNTGGAGAIMRGNFSVSAGNAFKILVGQQGASSTTGCISSGGAGGGGGSFVTTSANAPVIIGGGGGGLVCDAGPGLDANITGNGSDGVSPAVPNSFGVGGTGGNGATNSPTGSPHGGNGGGFFTDGQNAQCGGPGLAFPNGGAGGTGCVGNENGGYGGGAAGGNEGGGGGGGYSGGGGSYHHPGYGGGGGSYNNGSTQSNLVGNTGNGVVTVAVMYFNNFGSQNISVCGNVTTPINSNLTVTGPSGHTLTWTATLLPGHGTLSSLTTTAASGNNITPTGFSYTPTGSYSGTDVFTYQVSDGTNTATTTISVTITPVPVAITGTLAVCAGATTTSLTDAAPGGTWTSSTTTVATIDPNTAVVTVVGTGNTLITHTTGCSPDATKTFSVNPLPANISGPGVVCQASQVSYTDLTAFGEWTSSNTTVATIGTGSGIVTGVSGGTSTLTYTLLTGCYSTGDILVNPLPSAISGNMVCFGSMTTLSDAGGGTWLSSNPSVATIDMSTGSVNGVAVGTSTISYTLPTTCMITGMLTVNPLPVVSAGSNVAICNTFNTTLNATGANSYSWSPSDGLTCTDCASPVASPTVTTTYTVTGTQATTGSFTFNYTGGQQTFTVPAGVTSVNVDAQGAEGGTGYSDNGSGTPGYGGRVQATLAVTPGQVINIFVGGAGSDGTSGTGGSGGYNGGGAANGDPSYNNSGGGGGGGASDIRIGGVALTDRMIVASGGGGSTYNGGLLDGGNGGGLVGSQGSGIFSTDGGYGGTQIAGGAGGYYGSGYGSDGFPGVLGIGGKGGDGTITIHGTHPTDGGGGGGGYYGGGGGSYGGGGGGSSYADATYTTGVTNTPGVNNLGNGIVTINYFIPGCSNTSTVTVTVNPLPSAITGNNVCIGSTTTLSDAGGGTWMSDNTSVATIDMSSGALTGVSANTANVTYTLPTTCWISEVITVNPLPSAITGSAVVCAGLSTNALSDADAGGAWSSDNTSEATVDAGTGVVTGVSAGNPNIMFTNTTTGCMVSSQATVNPLPAAIVGNSVCFGLSTTLTDATGTGSWSNDNTAIATIDPSTGVITSVNLGTTTVTYTLGTGCIMSTLFTVNPIPSAIIGKDTVCPGMTISLSDAGGGTWTSDITTIATVNSGTGVVTGVANGTDNITYTLPTSCMITASVYVLPRPHAYTVTGGGRYCSGDTGVVVGLNGSDTGFHYRLWYSGAPIDTLAGTDSALNFGLHTLAGSYTVIGINDTTGCTTTMASHATIGINRLPRVHTVTGGGTFCAGGTGEFVGLNGSYTGNSYKLYNGGTFVDSLTGIDAALNFGLHTAGGIYKVVAINRTTGCMQKMADSAVIVVNPLITPAVSFYPHDFDTVCQGSLVTFNATPFLGGHGPVYQWSVNGATVGFDAPTYSYVPTDGDVVAVVLKSDTTCLTTDLASNEVTMKVDTVYIPAITISGYTGGVVSKGQSVTLTAVVTNGGPSPKYQWIKNGTLIAGATNASYTSTTLANKDSVAVMVLGTAICGMPSFNSVIMQVSALSTIQAGQGIDVTVIPNPNSGIFTVKGSLGTISDEEVTLEITNMLGQSIYKNKIMAQEGAINEQVQLANNVASGMYLLNVISGNEHKVFHVIVSQ